MKTFGKKSKILPIKEEDEIFERLLQAQADGYQEAFETAVRTGTCLIFYRNGKLIKYKPPFKYVMVPIKPRKKKKKS